jgi:hypothetical protein
MLRGTLVLFAGMFTVLILRRQLYIHHWLGMVLITAGAALVGASSVLYAGKAGGSASGGGGSRALRAWGLGAGVVQAPAGFGGGLHDSGSDAPVAEAPLLGEAPAAGSLCPHVAGPGCPVMETRASAQRLPTYTCLPGRV